MAKQGSIYPTIQPPPVPSRRRPGSDFIQTSVPPPIPKRSTSIHNYSHSRWSPDSNLGSFGNDNFNTDTGNTRTSPYNEAFEKNKSGLQSFLDDIEGLDFSIQSDTISMRRSSSLEDLGTSQTAYPDISHAFRELTTKTTTSSAQNFIPVQNFNPTVQQRLSPSCAPPSYGWNPNFFSNGTTNTVGQNPIGFENGTSSSFNNAMPKIVLNNPKSNTCVGMSNFSAKQKQAITQTFSHNNMGPISNPPNIGFILPNTGVPGNPFEAIPNKSQNNVPPGATTDNFGTWCSRSSSLPRPASWADMLDTRGTGSSDSLTNWNQPEKENTDKVPDLNLTIPPPNADLIQLSGAPMVEHEYLSLDYFDPLYNRGRRESVSVVSAGADDTSFNYSFGDAFPSINTDNVQMTPDTEKFCQELGDWAGSPSQMWSAGESETHVKEVYDPFSDKGICEEPIIKRREKTESKTPPRPDTYTPPKPGQPEKLRNRLFIDEESDAFCQMVAELKSKYKSTDMNNNPGYILCPIMDAPVQSTSVKIIVFTSYNNEPFKFTCDTDIIVEHVISQVLCNESPVRGNPATADDFILKVYDRALYLKSDIQLCCCEYVHQCLKLDQDIKFEMLNKQQVSHPFLRTVDDDSQMLYFPKEYIKTDDDAVSKEHLDILMETFYSEIEKLRDHVLQGRTHNVNPTQLHQSVKALCAILAKVETTEITKAIERLTKTITDLNKPNDPMSQSTDKLTIDAIHTAIRCSYIEELEESLELLVVAVKQLIRMYCQTFHTDFTMGTTVGIPKDHLEITSVNDNFIVHVATAHRLPASWTTVVNSKYDEFKVIFSLFHGNRRLAPDVSTSVKKASSVGLCDRIVWDEWLQFESTPLCLLPRECRLCSTLIGLRILSNTDTNNKVSMTLGGATIQLFSQRGHLVQGHQLVPLQMGLKADHLMPSCKTLLPDSVLLQVNLPDFDKTIFYPDPISKKTSDKRPFDALFPEIRDTVTNVVEKECSAVFDAEEMEILWQYRNYLHEHPNLLPRILQGARSWDWGSLVDIYRLISEWPALDPIVAFELLLPQYPDLKVRQFAIKCINNMNTDDLVDFLPQLIQALKFESYHNSSLAQMLLEQSCKSIRFAHQFFWLLKGVAAQDAMFKRRYELMFVALASVAGDALYQEFKKQEDLVKILTTTADRVQTGRDKEAILRRELQVLYERFEEGGRMLMPYNPSIEVSGLEIKSCSYYTSNAFPLKLVFKNSNSKADPVYVMYKVGDDLRQDMLTLQMVNVMDQLWLKNSLDLKMITFSCLATGPKKGYIELVTESDTLRKIQVSSGVTGSFKDRPIKEWLQRHNPTELEYRKAVENFTYSCAGYCVAMYVLGVGDRHNDNIMLKQSGHLFHIDFSKFLGDSQMFGSFKRDRVPFVLTSDMVYVINDGEKQTGRFQHFIDLCSQAFNILRKHHDLFYSLFMLMSRSGIPGVTENAAQYVKRALLPGQTDAQASAMFTRMIEESVKSVFTQFNFFIHNLAQLKFSSHQEGALLSFVTKTYNLQTDGKIAGVQLFSIQKRYTPDKHYIYILKIDRENQRVSSYIFRLFQEFVEFRDKLAAMFPLISWTNFSTRMVLGRSNIRTVAESRRVEIEQFLQFLLRKAPEISQCDLVYTFFHPLLRDEQEESSKRNYSKLKEQVIVQPISAPSGIQGDIKLSLQYKKDIFHVMIIHVRNLPSSGTDLPSPYVKTYLLPDPEKHTKRKTKIIKNSANPTYNELLEYKMSLEQIRYRILQVTVWDHDILGENNFLGAVYLKLQNLNLSQEDIRWHPLQRLQMSGNNFMS